MNASVETTKTEEMSWMKIVAGFAWHYLGGRRGLIALAVVVIAAGLFLGWEWLAAVGVVPLLLALAPCAAMCALGLCMSRMGGKSCSSESAPANPTTVESTPNLSKANNEA